MGDSLVTSVQGIQATSWIRSVQAGFPLDINVVDCVCAALSTAWGNTLCQIRTSIP